MQAGKLRHVIKIQKRTDVASEVGQTVPAWSLFARDVPAEFNPERGREYFVAQGMVVVEAARFRIRYLDGVVSSMRILFRDKLWDVANVEDIGGRTDWMYLYCATGLTEG